jgi:hypothetical protein
MLYEEKVSFVDGGKNMKNKEQYRYGEELNEIYSLFRKAFFIAPKMNAYLPELGGVILCQKESTHEWVLLCVKNLFSEATLPTMALNAKQTTFVAPKTNKAAGEKFVSPESIVCFPDEFPNQEALDNLYIDDEKLNPVAIIRGWDAFHEAMRTHHPDIISCLANPEDQIYITKIWNNFTKENPQYRSLLHVMAGKDDDPHKKSTSSIGSDQVLLLSLLSKESKKESMGQTRHVPQGILYSYQKYLGACITRIATEYIPAYFTKKYGTPITTLLGEHKSHVYNCLNLHNEGREIPQSLQHIIALTKQKKNESHKYSVLTPSGEDKVLFSLDVAEGYIEKQSPVVAEKNYKKRVTLLEGVNAFKNMHITVEELVFPQSQYISNPSFKNMRLIKKENISIDNGTQFTKTYVEDSISQKKYMCLSQKNNRQTLHSTPFPVRGEIVSIQPLTDTHNQDKDLVCEKVCMKIPNETSPKTFMFWKQTRDKNPAPLQPGDTVTLHYVTDITLDSQRQKRITRTITQIPEQMTPISDKEYKNIMSYFSTRAKTPPMRTYITDSLYDSALELNVHTHRENSESEEIPLSL